jgi:hypothetical protein
MRQDDNRAAKQTAPLHLLPEPRLIRYRQAANSKAIFCGTQPGKN